jgi:hypothetical protein
MPNVGMLSTTILGVLASKMFAYIRIFLYIFVLFLQNGLLKQKLHSISSLIESWNFFGRNKTFHFFNVERHICSGHYQNLPLGYFGEKHF